MSPGTQKFQFKSFNAGFSLFPFSTKINQTRMQNDSNNKNNKEKKTKYTDIFKPSKTSFITPLNVMKASETTSEDFQNKTTYEFKNTSNLTDLANKPLDEIQTGETNNSTSINLNKNFQFRNSQQLQAQQSK